MVLDFIWHVEVDPVFLGIVSVTEVLRAVLFYMTLDADLFSWPQGMDAEACGGLPLHAAYCILHATCCMLQCGPLQSELFVACAVTCV